MIHRIGMQFDQRAGVSWSTCDPSTRMRPELKDSRGYLDHENPVALLLADTLCHATVPVRMRPLLLLLRPFCHSTTYVAAAGGRADSLITSSLVLLLIKRLASEDIYSATLPPKLIPERIQFLEAL